MEFEKKTLLFELVGFKHEEVVNSREKIAFFYLN